jgi:TPR repeat protein
MTAGRNRRRSLAGFLALFLLLGWPGFAGAKTSSSTPAPAPIDSSVLMSNLEAAAQNGDALAVLPSNAEISPNAIVNPALIRSTTGGAPPQANGPFSPPPQDPDNPSAAFISGSRTIEGAGAPPSKSNAAPAAPDPKVLAAAAAKGDGDYQFALGHRYETGQGAVQDYAEAARWYRLAARQDHAEAAARLGYLYHHGLGVAQDYAEAAQWYRRAADKGEATAQNALGFFYVHGLGVAQDDAAAVKWISRAASQGRPDAQFNLGSLYLAGRGITRSYRESYFWLTLAVKSGDQDAPAARRLAASALDDGEIARIEARASAWKPAAALSLR